MWVSPHFPFSVYINTLHWAALSDLVTFPPPLPPLPIHFHTPSPQNQLPQYEDKKKRFERETPAPIIIDNSGVWLRL